jgi:endonuclease G, mitochondrial
MAAPHFPPEYLHEIRSAVLDILGYDPMTRNALLATLPPSLKGLMPGGIAPPAIGLTLDLDFLNGIERLTDGSVPLKRFLENAVGLTAPIEAADILRRALVDVEIGTTGAPLVVTIGLPEIHEAVILRDDMVPFGFLRGGIIAAQAVAKLLVPRRENGEPKLVNGKPEIHIGTGWVIAPGLIMTNCHVVNARNQGEPPASEADLQAQASAMSVLFDYDDEGAVGNTVAPIELIAWDPALDYALIRVADTTRAALPRAAAAISDVRPGSAMAVNIIQHPDGRPKRFGIRNNLLTAATPTEIRYFTDTLGGSSGSPVLNDRWEVVAVHRGTAFVRGVKFQGRSIAYVNVGTQITAILQHLQKAHTGKVPELSI